MFGGLGNMLDVLKGAKEMQSKMAALQAELAARRYDAQTGGGLVCVTVDGKGTVINVKIDPKAAEDVELLEDLVKSAVCSAVDRAQSAMREELSKLTGGLNLPGLDGLLPG